MPISAAKVAKTVQKGLQKLGNLRIALDYVAVVPGTYDPVTDAITTTTTTVADVFAVAVRLKEQELDWFQANLVTQKLLIPSLDLPAITPDVNDYVLISGVRWNVKRVSRMPGDPLWVIYIQEP